MDININEAPKGGVFTISPTTGTTLSTSFYWNTYNWNDDPNDFPLDYTFYYYSESLNNKKIVKTASPVKYANVLMGQGAERIGYACYCFVTVLDLYGGATTMTTSTITVSPQADLASIQNDMTAILTQAYDFGDSTTVNQVLNAVTTSINAANCTNSPDCSTLNREPCTSITDTCGKCLTGYVGEVGSFNSLCTSYTELSRRRIKGERNDKK